jgi:hypothetical protein
MAEYEIDSYAEAIEHAVDTVLAQEQALTPVELVQLLEQQLD